MLFSGIVSCTGITSVMLTRLTCRFAAFFHDCLFHIPEHRCAVHFFVIPSAFFVIPSESEESSMDASLRYASFSMTSAVSFQVLFLSFRALFFVIPSESEESSMDASLRSAWQKRQCHSERSFLSFRAQWGIPCMDASLRSAPQGSHVEYFCCLHSILIINTT